MLSNFKLDRIIPRVRLQGPHVWLIFHLYQLGDKHFKHLIWPIRETLVCSSPAEEMGKGGVWQGVG